jgi:predicted enzyme related to lactoylglutathione lyase
MQVIFAVADLARSLDFYERAFGWPRNEWIDYANYVALAELAPRSWGETAAWFADPDGNVVAVVQPAAVSSPTA